MYIFTATSVVESLLAQKNNGGQTFQINISKNGFEQRE